MSILIKGMEMPTSCEFCPCEFDGDCLLNRDIICTYKPCKRPPDCPLVPVPAHGRLIDADALDKAFTQNRWGDDGLRHWGDRKNWCMFGDEVETLFNSSPTIIPAEEGET